jgi:hypothetical protein
MNANEAESVDALGTAASRLAQKAPPPCRPTLRKTIANQSWSIAARAAAKRFFLPKMS